MKSNTYFFQKDPSPEHQIEVDNRPSKIYKSIDDFSIDDMQCEEKAKIFFDIATKAAADLSRNISKKRKANRYLANTPKEVYTGPVCIFCEVCKCCNE
jgi:hypothetical protein